MPIGYLVTTLLLLLCTLLALAPVRQPWPLSMLSFRVGYLLNELPFVGFYWLLASTALAVGQGDVHSAGGWLVCALAVVTTLGLAVVALRGSRAATVLDRALDDGLGAGWRDAIDPGASARLRRGLPYPRILFAPFVARRGDVERVSNVRYGPAGRWNLLDVYRHRSLPTDCPVLVHLHGGALFTGRKSHESRALLYRLASQGWLCVSANYRLSPAARIPDHLVDAKKVIAWVREHAHEYGGDPATLIMSGSSSGGQLATLAALTPNDPVFQRGFEHADTSVSAAISLYGAYGRVDTRQRSPYSPLAYPGTKAPPFLAVHGDQDTVLLVDGARLFTERLRTTSSQPVVFAELPGGQHSFDLFHSLRFEAVVNAVEAFAAWVHSTRAGTREDAQEA